VRPQQHSVMADQRSEDDELSAALAASLTDYQHQQRQHQHQHQHQHQRAAAANSSHPSARIDIDAVNAVAQVQLLEPHLCACDSIVIPRRCCWTW
jgi:hypothetical protein